MRKTKFQMLEFKFMMILNLASGIFISVSFVTLEDEVHIEAKFPAGLLTYVVCYEDGTVIVAAP
jgi:hypothetical protein